MARPALAYREKPAMTFDGGGGRIVAGKAFLAAGALRLVEPRPVS